MSRVLPGGSEEHRAIYRREGKGFPSDLRDAEWVRLEPLIPQASPGGRPRKTNMRAAMNAILYLLRTARPDGAKLIVQVERDEFDGDVGEGGGIGREASAQRVKVGQLAGIESGIDDFGELGLAGAVMGKRQQPDHDAARSLLGSAGQQRLEGASIGAAREELLAVDEIEQGHGLATQGMDDVPVIDDVAVLAVGVRAAAAQGHQRRRAEEAFEPVVIKAHPQDGRSDARAPNRTPCAE